MSATKCDNCGCMSKEHDEEREEACSICDGGKMQPLIAQEDDTEADGKMYCEDCGDSYFTVYNKDKGILSCADCGKLYEIANPLTTEKDAVAESPAAMAGSISRWKKGEKR